ncbi:MAG TPA: hypothetical protein VLU91_00535 [Nitrososphaerales archaeon]|nr:hypothetical protein [Nitrososphaerales archaeon]
MADPNADDFARKLTMAQEMLGRVIHTTDNLDEKIGKVFSSMSFLTAGATILYTAFLADKLYYFVGGVDLVSLFFLAFMISVAVATGFMLQAMGPRVHFIPWKRPGGKATYASPTPTGYADKISSMQESEWMKYLTQTRVGELAERWFSETIVEAYALSKKVDRKAGEMRGAQWFYILSIFFLVVMVILAAASLL